jgi:hypothetical protein
MRRLLTIDILAELNVKSPLRSSFSQVTYASTTDHDEPGVELKSRFQEHWPDGPDPSSYTESHDEPRTAFLFSNCDYLPKSI